MCCCTNVLCILLPLFCLLLFSLFLNREVHFWLRKQCPGEANIEWLDEAVPCSWDPSLLSVEGEYRCPRCGQRDRGKPGRCVWTQLPSNYPQWWEGECTGDDWFSSLEGKTDVQGGTNTLCVTNSWGEGVRGSPWAKQGDLKEEKRNCFCCFFGECIPCGWVWPANCTGSFQRYFQEGLTAACLFFFLFFFCLWFNFLLKKYLYWLICSHIFLNM